MLASPHPFPPASPDDTALVWQVAKLDRESLLYLSKKLVLLSRLLEHDTISDDAKYPTFFA